MAYVALSRVTSLEGLHLLAFDASKMFSSPNAIKEYNRLRKEYRLDLPQLTIFPKKSIVASDIPVFTNEKTTNSVNNTSLGVFNIKDFKNIDRSCYANAMLQTLFCVTEFANKYKKVLLILVQQQKLWKHYLLIYKTHKLKL